MRPEHIQTDVDILVAPVYLLYVSNHARAFCRHGCNQKCDSGSYVRGKHIVGPQLELVVVAYHHSPVRVAQQNLRTHVYQMVHEEKPAFEHLLVYELKVVQARANYQRALMENTANNLIVSDANIEELHVRLNQKKTDYLRYEQLYVQKAVTRQQYDNAKADYEAAKAKYDMLVRSKKSTALVKDEQTQRLEQNQTNIDVAKAAQNLAELNLSYTVIVAPCDGVTSRRSIQEGQFIQPGQTLLSLVEYGNVWVIANYKETQTANIREGRAAHTREDRLHRQE